ncbi:MAG: FG-GAP-like repeat-containing protein [Candidatus Acidiferrales bacterium]
MNWAPGERDYFLHREIAKSRLVQAKVDLAERQAISGHLTDARHSLLAARYLDPTNTVVRDRFAELNALEPGQSQPLPQDFEVGNPIRLEYQQGKQDMKYRGNTQGAYEEAARNFGVEVAFDVDLRTRPVHVEFQDADFLTTMRLLNDATGTFWRPLTRHLFFVSDNTAQKRKEYEISIVRTVLLPASVTTDQMTELLRLVREIAGITRSDLDSRSRTLTMRASPQAIAVATSLIEDLEKPAGELILEIEVLEVDRNYARQLGVTPPENTKIFTITKQEVLQAQKSFADLVAVLTEIFGLPSSLSGLTNTQITSLLNSGQLGIGTLLPPLIAFGGGSSTFIGTVPGATANFAEMLSLVRHGRRILLRVEDGKSATFFVGDRVPVTLAQFSASLGSANANISNLVSTNFPTSELPTGVAPAFIATGDLRNKSQADLIVVNHTDNTLSVFLSNGDGTFQDAISPAPVTGGGPVWIASGNFNSNTTKPNNDLFLDLAVVNQTDNTISILLGNGDGTFKPKTDVATGNVPSSAVAADLNGDGNADLIVTNHTDNTMSVFLGNGDGTFQTPTVIPTGAGPSAIVAADFNLDGKIDLAVTNQTDNTVSIFIGNGDGTFKPRVDYPTGNSPLWVSTADVSGDGMLDLVVANNTDNTVSVLLGVGDGTFGAKTDYPAGNGPTSIAIADYSQDGLLDLAVTDQSDNAVSLLLGLGSGTFSANFELPVGSDPVSMITADFNADGRPDAAVANMGSNTATVILNSSNFSVPNGFTGSPFPGTEYLDIGVKVKATPRIHPDDEVTLQLRFEISSLKSESLNGIPEIANQTVEQTVRLKENETSAISGILEEQVMRAIGGTPGLADLEGIGYLLGNRNATVSDTELLILITPRVVALAPHKDHTVYAGRGTAEGPGGITPTLPFPGRQEPVIPPNPSPAPGQPPAQPFQPPPGQIIPRPVTPPPTPPPNPN